MRNLRNFTSTIVSAQIESMTKRERWARTGGRRRVCHAFNYACIAERFHWQHRDGIHASIYPSSFRTHDASRRVIVLHILPWFPWQRSRTAVAEGLNAFALYPFIRWSRLQQPRRPTDSDSETETTDSLQ